MSAQMIAMLATPYSINDTSWYPNPRATNHCTSDVTNLMSHEPYTGPKQVHTKDGSELSIHHIGPSQFLSLLNSKLLSLTNMLHVPLITKNLINFSCFTKDNFVFFEFHSDFCSVKDQVTKAIQMHEKLVNGLYCFDSSSFLFHNAHSSVSFKSSKGFKCLDVLVTFILLVMLFLMNPDFLLLLNFLLLPHLLPSTSLIIPLSPSSLVSSTPLQSTCSPCLPSCRYLIPLSLVTLLLIPLFLNMFLKLLLILCIPCKLDPNLVFTNQKFSWQLVNLPLYLTPFNNLSRKMPCLIST